MLGFDSCVELDLGLISKEELRLKEPCKLSHIFSRVFFVIDISSSDKLFKHTFFIWVTHSIVSLRNSSAL